MANFKFLILACVGLLPFTSANAAYGSLKGPAGWSKNGSSYFKPMGVESWDTGTKTWKTLAQLNTGGRSLAVPVSLKLADVAKVTMSRGVGLHPALLIASVAGPYVIDWLMQEDITYNPSNDTFTREQEGLQCSSNCYEWRYSPYASDAYFKSQDAACQRSGADRPVGSGYGKRNIRVLADGTCTFELYYLSTGNFASNYNFVTQSRAIPPYNTAETVVVPHAAIPDLIKNSPFSPILPSLWPDPLEVDPPVFNPNESGVPQVLRIPQGSPIPVPNSDPQKWRSPVIDVIPSPTPDDPWRVEIVPRDIVKTNPTPVPDPLNPTDPGAPVNPDPVQPDTPEGQEELPPEEIGLCDLYPEILACVKLDEPEEPELEEKEIPISVTPDSGWGANNANCPAAKHITVQGRDVPIPYDLFCTYMSGIRPLVLSMAWLSAGFILLGVKGGD